MLSLYNSNLTCLRDIVCKKFRDICCNSKFVFGLWRYVDDSDDDDEDNNEQDKRSSGQWIQVHHLDTLNEAFELRVPKKYRIYQIVADEHHVVAVSRSSDEPESRDWFMSIFDLATCNEIDGDKTARFSLPEEYINLELEWYLLADASLLDGWLVVPTYNDEIFWYDKTGKRSETSTELNMTQLIKMYASRWALLFLVALTYGHLNIRKRFIIDS